MHKENFIKIIPIGKNCFSSIYCSMKNSKNHKMNYNQIMLSHPHPPMHCETISYTPVIVLIRCHCLLFCTADWSYAKGEGWEGAFLPLSKTCTSAKGAVPWSANHESQQVIACRFCDAHACTINMKMSN